MIPTARPLLLNMKTIILKNLAVGMLSGGRRNERLLDSHEKCFFNRHSLSIGPCGPIASHACSCGNNADKFGSSFRII